MQYLSVPSSTPRRTTQAGVTLVELVVTLAVVGILVAVAVPSMQRFLTAKAVDAQAQEMAATMRMARSEAMKRNMEVSVCSSENTEDASPSCSDGATKWSKGWVVFSDYDNSASLDGDDKALKVQNEVKGVKEISGPASALTFARSGILLTSAATVVFSPQLDDGDSGYDAAVRTLCVNKQGRVSVNPGKDFACP